MKEPITIETLTDAVHQILSIHRSGEEREARPVLAVSGGVDSMVLLASVARLSRSGRWNIPPLVFHLNHGIREEAAEDSRLVADFSRKLDLECFVYNRNIPALARRLSRSLEETGRIVRYHLLKKVCRKAGERAFVLTAHHADDFLETVLIRLIRTGSESSFQGLDSAGFLDGLLVLRPFLSFRKKTLEEIAHLEGIPFHGDATNREEGPLRNGIRHRLAPELEYLGLDPLRLIQHKDPELRLRPLSPESERLPWIRIDRPLLEGATWLEIKALLDRSLHRLGESPLSREVFGEFIRQLRETRKEGGRVRIETPVCHLWLVRGSPLFVIPGNSLLFREPRWWKESDGRFILSWNGQTRILRLPPDQHPGVFLQGMKMFLRAAEKGITKKVSEIFKEQRIPVSLRGRIPLILNTENRVVRILFSFLDGYRDLVSGDIQNPANLDGAENHSGS